MANLFYTLDFTDESKWEFNSEKVRLLEGKIGLVPTNGVYPTDSPLAESKEVIYASALASIEATIANDVTVILKVDGDYQYFNGTAWATSDKTVVQSNTLNEVNDNLASLTAFTSVYLVFVLNSASVLDATVGGVRVEYTPVAPSMAVETVKIFFNVRDFTNQISDITFSVQPSRRGMVEYKSSVVLIPNTYEYTTNGGYVEFDLVETDNMPTGSYYIFKIEGTRLLKEVPAPVGATPVNLLDLPDYVPA